MTVLTAIVALTLIDFYDCMSEKKHTKRSAKKKFKEKKISDNSSSHNGHRIFGGY